MLVLVSRCDYKHLHREHIYMNDHKHNNTRAIVDRVPQLSYLSHVPLPPEGKYKVTKEGYKYNHELIIIQSVMVEGDHEEFIRWKTVKGKTTTTHPDYENFRRRHDYKPCRPRKKTNKSNIRDGGAVRFNEPRRKEAGDREGDEYYDDETREEHHEKGDNYEEAISDHEDSEEEEEYKYEYGNERSFLPSANPWLN